MLKKHLIRLLWEWLGWPIGPSIIYGVFDGLQGDEIDPMIKFFFIVLMGLGLGILVAWPTYMVRTHIKSKKRKFQDLYDEAVRVKKDVEYVIDDNYYDNVEKNRIDIIIKTSEIRQVLKYEFGIYGPDKTKHWPLFLAAIIPFIRLGDIERAKKTKQGLDETLQGK